MRERRALAVHNKLLPQSCKLATHRGNALRLEPVHEVLWDLYSAGGAHAAHEYCTLPMVRAVAPWVYPKTASNPKRASILGLSSEVPRPPLSPFCYLQSSGLDPLGL